LVGDHLRARSIATGELLREVACTLRWFRFLDAHTAVAHDGAALLLWVTWLVAIATGAMAGARLPAWLHLDFLVPLYLVGQVVPRLRQSAPRRAAVIACAVAVLAAAAPMQLGIPAGILAGITAGLAHRTSVTAAKEASR